MVETIDRLVKTMEIDVLCGETDIVKSKQAHKAFALLIIELCKIELNIRYCSDKYCACQPECKLGHLIDTYDPLYKEYAHNDDYNKVKALVDDWKAKRELFEKSKG